MLCAQSGAWTVPDLIGGVVIVSGSGSWCSGEGSRSLYPSECKHCDPLLRKWLSNQSVESIVAKGNSCATTSTSTKSQEQIYGKVSIGFREPWFIIYAMII